MTRRRWIADEVSGNLAILTGEHADHLARVLRAQVGQEFDVATGTVVRRGRIVGVVPGKVELELGEEVPVAAIPPVTLLLSIFKFDRMEWAIEKCTELGVAKVVPVIAQRTEKHLALVAEKRAERWQRIARQASEQSRRVSPPEISPPLKLKEAASLPGGCLIVLAETEKELMLMEALRSRTEGDIVLAFGPEGGWTEAELSLFREAGWTAASLGATILRAETAAIAATAITMAEVA
jgi:16S rRNA (uracil1498-N3)-methyltransferase